MLGYVLDAREDHLRCLRDDSSLDNLPDDWELTLSDVTDSYAVIGMHSRKLGLSYEWTEDKGMVFTPLVVHVQEVFGSHRRLENIEAGTFLVPRRGVPVTPRRSSPQLRGNICPGLDRWYVITEAWDRHYWDSEIFSIIAVKMSLGNGSTFPFTKTQIDQVIERYQSLKGVPLSSVIWADHDV
jgi:hypothetical protein